MNFWTGYVLLIACGTLLYITLMNMLPEVYGREEGECDDIIPDVPEEKNKSETDENKTYGRGVQLITLLAGLLTAEALSFAPDPA